ncbi:hypothetical protein [Bacillus sp. AFS040349]|uniref:hypothetical protein n=1 Tax=Bacillus sp. AFS040349 TaxID=2033502 RepID=UPI00159BD6A6|nr:hypothetical protein [Bacillus sp. AFS040349]
MEQTTSIIIFIYCIHNGFSKEFRDGHDEQVFLIIINNENEFHLKKKEGILNGT